MLLIIFFCFRAMEFLNQCELLKIEDILPFFQDFVTIDHFKVRLAALDLPWHCCSHSSFASKVRTVCQQTRPSAKY